MTPSDADALVLCTRVLEIASTLRVVAHIRNLESLGIRLLWPVSEVLSKHHCDQGTKGVTGADERRLRHPS